MASQVTGFVNDLDGSPIVGKAVSIDVYNKSDHSIREGSDLSDIGDGSFAVNLSGVAIGEKVLTMFSLEDVYGDYTNVVGADFMITEAPAGPPPGDTGLFAGPTNVIDTISISTLGDASNFGDLTVSRSLLAATSNGNNARGIFGGGGSSTNVIDYVTITSAGDAQNFGDLTQGRANLAATSNGTTDRGIFGGGGYSDTIDYVTISSTGDASNFGDLTFSKIYLAANSNNTNDRGLFTYGDNNENYIDYVTISSTGNASDFADLTVGRWAATGTSNSTNNRGLFAGGHDNSATTNIIDYLTISSLGNAQDFGDLMDKRDKLAATSNGTDNRGVFAGGQKDFFQNFNRIDYVDISSGADAQDFGNLSGFKNSLTGTSDA